VVGIVEGTVRLDDEPVMQANEIQNVRTKGELPPELEAFEPAVAQQFPQLPLHGRRHAPQGSSLTCCRLADHISA
jgi:hypothetical protein